MAFEVTDGKRVIAGAFREVGRERLRTPAGEFATVVVEPTIEGLGGVFRKSKKAKLRIWFTDDAWRRPVRFYSEVAVGSFTMELTRLQEGRHRLAVKRATAVSPSAQRARLECVGRQHALLRSSS